MRAARAAERRRRARDGGGGGFDGAELVVAEETLEEPVHEADKEEELEDFNQLTPSAGDVVGVNIVAAAAAAAAVVVVLVLQ